MAIHSTDPQAPYRFDSTGADAGVEYVNVIDRDGNPIEYSVPRRQAELTYAHRHHPDDYRRSWLDDVANGDTTASLREWTSNYLAVLAQNNDDEDGPFLFEVNVMQRSTEWVRFRLEAFTPEQALRIVAGTTVDVSGNDPDREAQDLVDSDLLINTARVTRDS